MAGASWGRWDGIGKAEVGCAPQHMSFVFWTDIFPGEPFKCIKCFSYVLKGIIFEVHIWIIYTPYIILLEEFHDLSRSSKYLQFPLNYLKYPVSTSQSPPSPHSFAPVSHAYRHNGSQWSYDFLHPVARRRPSNWVPQKYPGGSHGVTSCAHVGITEALHTPTQKPLRRFQAAGSVTDSQGVFLGVGWWVFPAIPEGRGWSLGNYAAEQNPVDYARTSHNSVATVWIIIARNDTNTTE